MSEEGNIQNSGTGNAQSVSNSNPQINNTVTSDKNIDPIQMLAFDTARKIDGVRTCLMVMSFIILLSVVCTFFVGHKLLSENLTLRQQYDKLERINKNLERNVDKLKSIEVN